MRKLFITLMFLPSLAFAQSFSNPPAVITAVPPDADDMMVDFNQIITDGNAAFTDLQNQINAISGTPMPTGAVVPFFSSACPSGWLAANGGSGRSDMRGRFGRIASAAVGTVWTDQFLDHTHTSIGTYVTSIGGGNASTNVGAIANISAGNAVNTGAPTGNVGSETRPKNVALLYCQKS